MAYNTKKNNMFNTPPVEVKWANIAEPDDYAGSLNHQVVVWLDGPDGEALLNQIKELAGPEAHINGMGVQQGSNRPFMKFKSTVFTKEGETRFGRVFGADGKDTELNPYAGDIVKLRLSGPSQARNRPDAVSFFLNAVQVWEKKERDGGSGPFGANPDYVSEDPGFDAAPAPSVTPTAPAAEDNSDIPF